MERSRPRIPLLAFLVVALLAVFASAGAGGSTAAVRPAKKPPQQVPGELLIGFKAGVSTAEQKKVLGRIAATEKRGFKQIHGALVRVRADATASALAELRTDPRVRYAEPNFVVSADVKPNDQFFSRLWGLNNTGLPVGGLWGLADADIDAPEAWSVTTGSDAVTVGVIDTGIDYSHPDLSARMWINPGENCPGCRTDGIDNDGNGYVDDWRGWDFANGDNDPMDDNGHGTHVAGTIGATGNNRIGVTGVNWRVRLLPLKFLSAAGTGTTADAVSAVLYAADKGATVLNNSWGGDDYSQALADAITVADTHGALFVAAAGNSGTDNDSMPTYPVSYALPNVLTVAATDNWDQLAYFSNVGRKSVDLAAPGVNIYSTWPGGTYQYMSGTSMAAPHVSGAAALAKAAFPAATGVGLKALLLESVDPLASLTGSTATGGRLNVNNAVTCSGTPKLWFDSPSSGFDAEVGTPVSFSAIATRCADSSGVSVTATANGAPVALTARGDGLYTGSYTPTATGSINLSVSATAGGTTRTRTVSGIATAVSTITPGGPSVTITTRVPGETARLKFDGQAGQRVSLKLAPVTISTSYVSILNPDGTPLSPNVFVSSFNGGFVDTQTLPVTGSYRILVDPEGTATGSMTLTLYDVGPDPTAAIVPGGAASTATVATPGQNARLTFDAQPGQRVSLNLTGVTISSSYLSFLKPDGTTLGGGTYVNVFGGFLDTRTLPSAGTYTILVDPQDAATGSMTVTLYDVPPDAGGTIAFGGASPTVAMSTPGQNASLTFEGQAGQRASVKLDTTVSSAYVSILNPDGSVLTPNTYVGPSGGFLDPKALPISGTYRIMVDPQQAATGSMTLTLYDVPPDATATITPGGAPVTISANTPGQNARVSFDGQAGRKISLKLSATTIANAWVSILNPNGSALASNVYLGTFGGFVDTKVLPASGSYTILVDPQGAAFGSTTLTLYDVVDAAGSMTVGGPSLLTSLTTPGQNARITFAGRAGQHVTLQLSGVSVLVSYVTILKPDGTALTPSTLVTTSGGTVTADLPSDATYAIAIDPLGAETGVMTLSLN